MPCTDGGGPSYEDRPSTLARLNVATRLLCEAVRLVPDSDKSGAMRTWEAAHDEVDASRLALEAIDAKIVAARTAAQAEAARTGADMIARGVSKYDARRAEDAAVDAQEGLWRKWRDEPWERWMAAHRRLDAVCEEILR